MKNVADIYPLSPMQQLMLFHVRASKGGHDVLFNQIVYEISGPLDVGAYCRSWQLMVDRHAALRTIFVWQDGKDPLQVVREQVALPWAEHDWRGVSPAAQEAALDELLAADRAQGFDPLQAPLMRMNLVRLDESAYRLVWSSHHLIVDRWCIGVLFDEVKRAYEADLAGRAPDLRPAPRYRDYIAWLGEQDAEAAQAFWQHSLRDVQARPLVTRDAAAERAGDLAVFRAAVSGAAWRQVRRYAQDHNLTPGLLVSAAWALVMAAASGSDDVVFGLTVSGRPAEVPEIGRTVGSFINNVPLRVTLEDDRPVVAWLQALQEQQGELQAYEFASLAQIETWASKHGTGALFDTLLVMQAPVQLDAPDGLTIAYAGGGMQTGYPLSVGAVPDREELRLAFTYQRAAVSEALVQSLSSALELALTAMTADEEARIGDVLRQLPVEVVAVENGQPAAPILVTDHPFVPPRTSTERKLVQMWAEVLDVPRVGTADRFSELGGDSIRSLQLFAAVEQLFGASLPISLLFNDPTVADMAAALGAGERDSSVDSIVVPINESGSRPPVFFTHGVQGGLIWLKHVGPLLDPDVPAYGLQAIGLQPDEEPDRTLEDMAARYVEAMRRVQPTGPYHLAGYCFGGVLAYEVARQLEEQGQATAMLGIIDGFPPLTFHRHHPIYHPVRLQNFRQSAPYWFRGYEAFGGWRVQERLRARFGARSSSWEEPEFTAVSAADEYGAGDLAASTAERHRQLTKINERAGDSYMPGPYGGKVTLFRAELLGLHHTFFGPVDPERGWGKLARGGVAVRPVQGSHVGMLSHPYVVSLAQQLNEALRSALSVRP